LSRSTREDEEKPMKLYHLRGACSLADIIVLEWIGAGYEVSLPIKE
jgi:hypothetical protein